MTAEEKGKAPPAATPKRKSATQPTQSHPKGSERGINGHSVYRNAWLLTYLATAHPEAYNNALAQYQEHAVSQLIASGLECETCRQPTEGAYGKDRNQCLDCNIETAVLAKRKTEEMTTTMPPTQTEENATNEENRPAEAIKSRYYICALREDLYDWMIEEMGWATPSQRAQEPETDTVAVTPPGDDLSQVRQAGPNLLDPRPLQR